eukprot:g60162.t1
MPSQRMAFDSDSWVSMAEEKREEILTEAMRILNKYGPRSASVDSLLPIEFPLWLQQKCIFVLHYTGLLDLSPQGQWTPISSIEHVAQGMESTDAELVLDVMEDIYLDVLTVAHLHYRQRQRAQYLQTTLQGLEAQIRLKFLSCPLYCLFCTICCLFVFCTFLSSVLPFLSYMLPFLPSALPFLSFMLPFLSSLLPFWSYAAVFVLCTSFLSSVLPSLSHMLPFLSSVLPFCPLHCLFCPICCLSCPLYFPFVLCTAFCTVCAFLSSVLPFCPLYCFFVLYAAFLARCTAFSVLYAAFLVLFTAFLVLRCRSCHLYFLFVLCLFCPICCLFCPLYFFFVLCTAFLSYTLAAFLVSLLPFCPLHCLLCPICCLICPLYFLFVLCTAFLSYMLPFLPHVLPFLSYMLPFLSSLLPHWSYMLPFCPLHFLFVFTAVLSFLLPLCPLPAFWPYMLPFCPLYFLFVFFTAFLALHAAFLSSLLPLCSLLAFWPYILPFCPLYFVFVLFTAFLVLYAAFVLLCTAFLSSLLPFWSARQKLWDQAKKKPLQAMLERVDSRAFDVVRDVTLHVHETPRESYRHHHGLSESHTGLTDGSLHDTKTAWTWMMPNNEFDPPPLSLPPSLETVSLPRPKQNQNVNVTFVYKVRPARPAPPPTPATGDHEMYEAGPARTYQRRAKTEASTVLQQSPLSFPNRNIEVTPRTFPNKLTIEVQLLREPSTVILVDHDHDQTEQPQNPVNFTAPATASEDGPLRRPEPSPRGSNTASTWLPENPVNFTALAANEDGPLRRRPEPSPPSTVSTSLPMPEPSPRGSKTASTWLPGSRSDLPQAMESKPSLTDLMVRRHGTPSGAESDIQEEGSFRFSYASDIDITSQVARIFHRILANGRWGGLEAKLPAFSVEFWRPASGWSFSPDSDSDREATHDMLRAHRICRHGNDFPCIAPRSARDPPP